MENYGTFSNCFFLKIKIKYLFIPRMLVLVILGTLMTVSTALMKQSLMLSLVWTLKIA